MATDIEHFRNLVSLSAADGVIEESERVALSKIAFDKGIPIDRMNVMLNKASEYQFIVPQNMIDREKQLQEMIQFAKVDGNFCKAELDMITTVAEKLGFTEAEIKQYLEGTK